MNIVNQQTFHNAMSCMGTAVNIITTDSPARRTRFTTSAICSMTNTPPTLLVCLNHGASIWPVFNENQTLCVNTLSTRQEPLSNLFGSKTPMEHHFATTHWQTGVTRCPQLEEALVSFDCHISQVVSISTHNILFCAIKAIHHHTTPYRLVWFNHSYHTLMRPAC